MPQAIVTIFTQALWAAARYGVQSAVAAYAIATVATAAIVTAGLYGLQKLSEALVPIPKGVTPKADVEYTDSVAPRRVIFGTVRASGMNVIPPLTSGPKNEWLHQVLAVAGHEVNDISDVYFNQEIIADANISAITSSLSDGTVTSGKYQNKAYIRRYLGTSTQNVDFILDNTFAEWDTTHRGRGVAYVALRFQFDTEVYSSGKPQVSFIVQGAKVYDPRLDSTQTSIPGSGSQRVNDPSTWTYSNNPALCLTWYLLDSALGLGEASTRIDWDLVADAADICDELVSIPGSTTQKRYTCNVVLTATENYQDNIDVLRQAMMGVCYYAGGKWRMYAGDWMASAFTVTADDIVNNGIEIVTALDYNERYNGVRGSYIDSTQNYQETEFPAVSSTSYVTDDGEAAWKDVQFPACTNRFEAQRNAILVLRRSRLNQVLRLTIGPSGWSILPFQVGTFSIPYIGWSSKTARVEKWKPNPDGTVEITVREETSGDWTDPLVADYLNPTNVTPPASPTFIPDPPTDLAYSQVYGGVSLRWTPARNHGGFTRYNIYQHTASTPFSSATKVATKISGSTHVVSELTGTTHYYWVTAVDAIDNGESSSEPSADGVAAASIPVVGADSDTILIVDDPVVLNVTLSTSSISTTLDTLSAGNSASVTATADATNTPVSYAWTRQSGSTSITANSASSATTSFAVTGITNGQTLSAVFRCTVTDSSTPTARTTEADVTVSFTRTDSASGSTASVTTNAPSIAKAYRVLSGTILTGSITATATGGTGVFTFSWARQSGDTEITLNTQSDTSTTSVVTWKITADGSDYSAVWRVTATDTASPANTATADVYVDFYYIDPDGGGDGPIP